MQLADPTVERREAHPSVGQESDEEAVHLIRGFVVGQMCGVLELVVLDLRQQLAQPGNLLPRDHPVQGSEGEQQGNPLLPNASVARCRVLQSVPPEVRQNCLPLPLVAEL